MKYFMAGVLVVSCWAMASADVRGNIETERTLVAAQRKALITNAMQLTDEQSKAFWPIYNEYRNAMRKVGDQRVELITDYAKNYQQMTDEKATQLLNQMTKIDTERSSVREQYVKRFSKVLPGREVARFFQADNKIDAYINASIADDIPLVPTPEIQKLVAQEEAASAAQP